MRRAGLRPVLRGVLLLGILLCAGAVPAALADGGRVREVSIPGQTYAPSRLQVLVGDTVLWRNGDATDHTVTSDGTSFDSGYLAPGSTFTVVFRKSGRYAYHCTIHKFMKGLIVVVPVALQGPPAPVVSGGIAVLQGLAPAGARTVIVERLGQDHATRRVSPAADGSFTVRLRAFRPAAYRARVKRLASSQILVPVAPRVKARLANGLLSGRAFPSRAGARAALQRFDLEHYAWRTVATGRLDEASRVALPLPPGSSGRFRLVVRGGHGWAPGASDSVVT